MNKVLCIIMGVCFVVAGCAMAQQPTAEAAREIHLDQNPFLFGDKPLGNSYDTVPFYHDGVWHVFHMNTGGTMGHRVSRDLVNWEVRPIALTGGVATGSVVEHEGKFYFFYTANQTVHLATSTDLDHWTPYENNPVLTGDGEIYFPGNFRDPFVFFNENEQVWWLVVGTQQAGVLPHRSGCVGLAKSRDLLHWELCPPLWAPQAAYHSDCPQVIHYNNNWYLFSLRRATIYRIAGDLAGPWRRPVIRDLFSQATALAGSRPAFDGKHWVTFPFMCYRTDNYDYGSIINGELWSIPRQLDFHEDGSITERAVPELIAAIHKRPACEADLLGRAQTITGRWDSASPEKLVSHEQAGGCLLLADAPSDLYFECDMLLPKKDMDACLSFRVDPALTRGYVLDLDPAASLVSLRPLKFWDNNASLLTRHVDLPIGRPFKIRLFVAGTTMEVFLDERTSLSHRIYDNPEGGLALDFVDGPGQMSNVIIRKFQR